MKPVNGPVTPHVKRVKGGQFKYAVDIHAPGAKVVAPVAGKVAHVHKDKTRCGNPGLDSCQIAMSEEKMVPQGHSGDLTRKLTGRRVGLAHFVPVPGLSFDPLRHVAEGTVLGTVSGDTLHYSSNSAELIAE